jgi:hypothetical protein
MDVKGSLLIDHDLLVKENAKFDSGLDSAYLELVDEKLPKTTGGDFLSGDWRTRDLTIIAHDDFAVSVTLSANKGDGAQFVIPAGEYYIEAQAPGSNVDDHKARLADVTDSAGPLGATIIDGTTEFAPDVGSWRDGNNLGMQNASSGQTSSKVHGRFTVTRNTSLELQHRCATTQLGDGFGVDSSFYVTNNVFSIVKMWQVRDDTT